MDELYLKLFKCLCCRFFFMHPFRKVVIRLYKRLVTYLYKQIYKSANEPISGANANGSFLRRVDGSITQKPRVPVSEHGGQVKVSLPIAFLEQIENVVVNDFSNVNYAVIGKHGLCFDIPSGLKVKYLDVVVTGH